MGDLSAKLPPVIGPAIGYAVDIDGGDDAEDNAEYGVNTELSLDAGDIKDNDVRSTEDSNESELSHHAQLSAARDRARNRTVVTGEEFDKRQKLLQQDKRQSTTKQGTTHQQKIRQQEQGRTRLTSDRTDQSHLEKEKAQGEELKKRRLADGYAPQQTVTFTRQPFPVHVGGRNQAHKTNIAAATSSARSPQQAGPFLVPDGMDAAKPKNPVLAIPVPITAGGSSGGAHTKNQRDQTVQKPVEAKTEKAAEAQASQKSQDVKEAVDIGLARKKMLDGGGMKYSAATQGYGGRQAFDAEEEFTPEVKGTAVLVRNYEDLEKQKVPA